MGQAMQGYLEYRAGDRWESLDRGWDLARNSVLYRLLANVNGEGALYPPRGVPRDAGRQVRRDYLLEVVATQAEVRRLWARGDKADKRAHAEEYLARGLSEWWSIDGVDCVSNPEYRAASWLTTAEFRHVVSHYDMHIHEYLRDWRVYNVASKRNERGEWETQTWEEPKTWDASEERAWRQVISFRMLLAAMEAGEARGYSVRLIFWFHG